jgi:hypothetical protein
MFQTSWLIGGCSYNLVNVSAAFHHIFLWNWAHVSSLDASISASLVSISSAFVGALAFCLQVWRPCHLPLGLGLCVLLYLVLGYGGCTWQTLQPTTLCEWRIQL